MEQSRKFRPCTTMKPEYLGEHDCTRLLLIVVVKKDTHKSAISVTTAGGVGKLV